MATRERWATIVIATLPLCVLAATFACESHELGIIRQVDHILVASNDAEELFSVFSDTFQLPVVWPMSDYGKFASGGVSLGNVNLEIFRVPVSADSVVGAQFAGFALEPAPLQSALQELEAREIAHGSPTPFNSTKTDGSASTLWTTVMLPSVSNEAMAVFLCEYTHDIVGQRQHYLNQLRSQDGGPLSLESVDEIVCGVSGAQKSSEQWQSLLNPLLPSSPGVWELGGGPAVRVIQADVNGIRELVVSVRSLSRARGFLRECGLLDIDRPDGVTMAGPALQGLTIRLIESES